MDRMKKQMSAAGENHEQFEQLLTNRARELLQQPLRGKTGAYSENIRVFESQLDFCSLKAYTVYSELQRFIRLPSISVIRSWNSMDCRPRITALSMQKIAELVAESALQGLSATHRRHAHS